MLNMPKYTMQTMFPPVKNQQSLVPQGKDVTGPPDVQPKGKPKSVYTPQCGLNMGMDIKRRF
jgi:hypothetical protein